MTAIGGPANIIELEGTVGSSPGVARKQGFDETIAGKSGMSILVSQSGDFDQQKGHDLALQLIPQYPTANIIYSHNDAMSFGVIQAMSELGKMPGKDLTIISIDGTKQATQDVIDGSIAEVTECNPKFGPVLFDTIEKYGRGESIPLELRNTDRVFDQPGGTTVGDRTSMSAATYLPEAF
jgi:ribose transport system substrate-binding protein